MKKARFKKVLFTLLISTMILSMTPSVQYATTDASNSSFKHNITKMLTTLGVVTPHQDTFTAWMESDLGVHESVANYKTYYKAGDTLKIKVTFTTTVANVNNPLLVLKFGEDGIERVVGDYTIENDYIIFEYTLQDGDNGGLLFANLSGTVSDENGNSIEMAKPSDLSLYKNRIIADTAVPNPVTVYDVGNKEITFEEGIYIIDDNNNYIRSLSRSDIYLLDYINNTVTPASEVEDSVTIPNGENRIIINEAAYGAYDAICIDAVDIAGNPMPIHYYINDGSTQVDPIINVSVDETTLEENTVEDVTYCRAEKVITIKTWNSHQTENTKVGVAFGDGSYKDATFSGEIENNLYVWTYTVSEGDNGAVKVKVSGDCHCGNEFAENETTFENVVADTIAPEVKSMKIGLSAGNGWYAEKDKTNVDAQEFTSDSEIVEEGTLWINKNSTPKVEYTFSDENLNPETKHAIFEIIGDSSREIYANTLASGTSYTLRRPAVEGELTYELYIYDAAGNETIYVQPESLKVVVDHTGPEITVTSPVEATKEDTVEFTINVSDPDVTENMAGSGVRAGSEYKTVSPYDVIVTNGKIIKYDTSGNDLNITVMPNGNGYVSVYVPAEVIDDNLGNLNAESNIAKVQIDRTAPVITDIQGNPTNWVRSATLSVTAYDSDSGLAEEPYSFDGGVTWQMTNSTEIMANGTIVIAVKDKVGSVTITNVEVTKIDTVAPVINEIVQTQIAEYETEVIINAVDNESGLAEFSFDGGNSWQTSASKIYTEKCSIYANQLQVKDNVGHITVYNQTVDVEVKENAPVIKLENNGGKFVVPTAAEAAKAYITIEADAQNNCEIAYAVSYSKDVEPSNYEKMASNKVELELSLAEGTWYVWTYAKNTATGAESAKVVSEAFEVKKSIIEFNPSTTEKTRENVVVEIVYGDGLTENRFAGIGDAREAGLSSVTLAENGTLYAEATDIAGNKVYATFEVSNIEKQAITFDTTSEESCVSKVKTVDDVNYVMVEPGASVEDVLKYAESTYDLEVEKVSTNQKITADNMSEQYVIVVKGDVNADGKVDWADILKLNQARLQFDGIKQTNVELTAAEALASDVTEDDKITPGDMIKINKFRLGKIETL